MREDLVVEGEVGEESINRAEELQVLPMLSLVLLSIIALWCF